MLICVQFINQSGNGDLSFSICIVPEDALLVCLFDGNHGTTSQAFEFCEYFLCHLMNTVFNKPWIFMRGKDHRSCRFFSLFAIRNNEVFSVDVKTRPIPKELKPVNVVMISQDTPGVTKKRSLAGHKRCPA
jgi:hypothetical protein